MSDRGLNEIDNHIATRLRAARNLANLTQEQAGMLIDVSFQQMQKYEKGINRVSSGSLAVLAKAYGVSIDWFFEGAPGLSGKRKITTDWGCELTRLQGGAELAEALCGLSLTHHNLILSIAQELA